MKKKLLVMHKPEKLESIVVAQIVEIYTIYILQYILQYVGTSQEKSSTCNIIKKALQKNV